MRYVVAALCLVFAGAAYAEEQEVVVRDKNNNIYLVSYDCNSQARRAWVTNISVGEPIRIRTVKNQTKVCTITEVRAFA